MTNAELNSMKSEDMQFIKGLNELFVKVFAVKPDEEQAKIRKTPSGEYLWRVQSRIWDIQQNIEDIALTEQLISAHNPGLSRLDRTVNAGQMIRYNYENFFLRMGKMTDLFLLLINEVMMLKIKKGLNLEANVLKLLAKDHPHFQGIWSQVKQNLDELKPYRNHVAHNGFITMPDLALVNSFYTIDIKHKNRLEQYRYEFAISDIQKDLVEKFTAIINAHLANIDQYLKLIYLFITVPFFDNLKSLTKNK
ncbi:Cthe_2314 family HEPN domain-containing protein [Pararcticibacter amylolyticus]|uniref:Cthe-2314-like HEPN domain-containing protein n=1 Tax=Pararcticibacter amylolyticus TaxID=2173175 RepID=A0A2U2PHB0_9SPHI|nr:Cthe_2314 family HEPN domain-containing protein [Pararcticibacter amylolyticus]PWG80793.1 hypothetical protein DDR33_10070 [Pararcticibacter amylolyticus]